MSIHNEIIEYFEHYPDSPSMGLYALEHDEIFFVAVLSDKKEKKPFEVGISELGQSMIDFLYDRAYDVVIGTLLDSENYVKQILSAPDDVSLWQPFYSLLQSTDSQFFYFYLAQEIVTAYKNKMHHTDGTPYPTDYFCEIGRSYQRLRERVQDIAGKCFEETAKNGATAMECYLKHFAAVPISYADVQAEPIPAKEYNANEPMVYKMAEVLHPKTPEDIGNFLFFQYLKENILLKRCENCQKYFVATGRSNVKYCDREIDDTGKTCRQIIPAMTFRKKHKATPAEKVFNRAYKTFYSRMSAGKLSKELFKEWSKDARQKRDECISGKITIEDFERWIINGD